MTIARKKLRKDGEKGEGKKRKVEKRIFREIGSRITCARRSRIKGGPNVFSRPGTAVFILSSPSVCPRGPWKLLLTRPSLRDFCERKNEIQRTSGVRRPESSETRNGFLRFRRWQDERRVICLLSVDDKARSSLLLEPELSSVVPRIERGILAPFPRGSSLFVQRLSTRIYLHGGEIRYPLSILLPDKTFELAEKLRRPAPRWIRPIIFHRWKKQRGRREVERGKEIIFLFPASEKEGSGFRKIGRRFRQRSLIWLFDK